MGRAYPFNHGIQASLCSFASGAHWTVAVTIMLDQRRRRLIGDVLQFQDLQELCRPGERPRLATVEAWARTCGIRYKYDGKGGIWTTAAAMNAALGLQLASNEAYGTDVI